MRLKVTPRFSTGKLEAKSSNKCISEDAHEIFTTESRRNMFHHYDYRRNVDFQTNRSVPEAPAFPSRCSLPGYMDFYVERIPHLF